ncbi:MAG: dTDP-4-dehydrorhamnose reductase [Deltaproteobacteria bacterium]|nr:MAG: dTDP-4-dehydrorhamnose reductase [Deltaproteobacteria bacterium]
MRVLITGARGMLGSDLSLIIVGEKKHQLVETDIAELPESSRLDITWKEKVNDFIAREKPEVVVNTAGYTDVDGCEKNVELAFSVNSEGVKNLALACLKSQTFLVHLSTDYIFDGRKGMPYCEDDLPNPLSIYGRSKLQGEVYLEQILDHYLLIRTQWLCGRRGKNFIETILNQVRDKKELRVVDDQWGSPTFTRDLSWAIKELIEKGAKGIYHVVNYGYCSWFQFAQKILELNGGQVDLTPIRSAEINRPAPRPPFSVLSTEKLKKNMGIVLPAWQDSLKEYLSKER